MNLKTFSIERRELPQQTKGLSYDEILEKKMEKFKFSLLNVARLNKKVFLPLTAGYDSRLLLAACHYAGIKVETYTAGQPRLSADLKLPYKLAKQAGCCHLFIKMKESEFRK